VARSESEWLRETERRWLSESCVDSVSSSVLDEDICLKRRTRELAVHEQGGGDAGKERWGLLAYDRGTT
jgi:hypothetical protein